MFVKNDHKLGKFHNWGMHGEMEGAHCKYGEDHVEKKTAYAEFKELYIHILNSPEQCYDS